MQKIEAYNITTQASIIPRKRHIKEWVNNIEHVMCEKVVVLFKLN